MKFSDLIKSIFVCAMAVAFVNGSDLKKGLVGHWTFDLADSSGLTIYDRAGENGADLSEGSGYTEGRHGRAAQFDGLSGFVKGDAAPVLGQNFTIAAWFKSDDLANGQHSIYAGDVKGCHYLRINQDGQMMLIRADILLTGASRGKVKGNEWTHVAVTYTEDGKYSFFINGQDAGTGSVKPEPFVDAKRFSLGQVFTGGPTRAMKGALDEVRVYNRALSSGEVAELTAVSVIPPASAGEITKRRKGTLALHLKAGADFNWFVFGKPLVFRAEGQVVPESLTHLKGVVHDAQGRPIDEVRVTREKLLEAGWSWSPSAPGYFEIAFSMTAAGKDLPIATSYNLGTAKGLTRTFSKDRQSVAVMPEVSSARRSQFGFSYGNGLEKEVALANVFGFSFARWHYIPWGGFFVDESKAVEPAQGEFHWENTDPHFELLKKSGFVIVGNVLGTPAWASPFPDDKTIDIGIVNRNMYAPVKMEYYADFLTALVGRYGKDIKTWELWNEPHLRGSSIFWKDTTTNFIRLLTAGYEALKRVQPESEVWIGGMGGRRYLPFYREFLKLGGAPFDRLVMHGTWQDVSGFRELEKEFKVPSKPWLSSEWHSVLVSGMANPPSETAISKRMILDLCDQIQNGAEKITVFNIFGGSEKEILPDAYADGSFQQSFSLFRSKPRMEPRFPAVVLRTFMDQIQDRLTYRALVELGPEQKMMWFLDGGKSFAVAWTDGKKPSPIDPRLKSALDTAAVTGWEGSPVVVTGGSFSVEPERFYFVKGMPVEILAALPTSSLSLNPNKQVVSESSGPPVPRGAWRAGRFFESDLKVPEEAAKIPWNEKSWTYVGMSAKDKPANLRAKYAVAFSTSGLDLLAEVVDQKHVPAEKAPEFWNGDSIQFALDADGTGNLSGATEFVVALTSSGPVIYKTFSVDVGGDIPQRWSPARKPTQYAKTVIERQGEVTRYLVHVDNTELYPFAFDPLRSKGVRFSVLVNNNDGAGRGGYLEWSSGIGDGKLPGRYGKLENNLFGFDPLKKGNGWNDWKPAGVTAEYREDVYQDLSSVKLTIPSDKMNAGLISGQVPVEPGGTYTFKAKVRGQGKLLSQLYQYDASKKAIDKNVAALTGSGYVLASEWREVSAQMTAAKNAATCTLNFLFFQTMGEFEITDVRMFRE